MAKIITLIKKTYRCLRKKGINGIIEKIDNVSQTKTDVIGFYDYIMDVTPIPLTRRHIIMQREGRLH